MHRALCTWLLAGAKKKELRNQEKTDEDVVKEMTQDVGFSDGCRVMRVAKNDQSF